jgi:nicotinate phosphoribosyltransferase
LVESFLLNALNYQSLIATKTARICQAAQGEPVLEFGLRRAQGPDGGLSGSRAAYIGGAVATSNVLAGKLFGIPVRGTHAHSWVMRFPTELEAFQAFAETFPKSCVLLVDTYDTLRSGVPNAIEIFKSRPSLLPAIRIDSGDLAKLSKSAHAQFARAGMPHVQIIGTNDLDEDLIADLKRQGAKINVWAVGTHLITSKDHPALDGVYKLVAIEDGAAWAPRIKISSNPEKATDPGLKQPYRCWNEKGEPLGDVLLADGEPLPQPGRVEAMDRQYLHQPRIIQDVARMTPLMQSAFGPGGRLPRRTLDEIRSTSQESLRSFPEEYLRLRNPEIYWIGLSCQLAELKSRTISNIRGA